MKTMTIDCPDRLAGELDAFVREGWAVDVRAAVARTLLAEVIDQVKRG